MLANDNDVIAIEGQPVVAGLDPDDVQQALDAHEGESFAAPIGGGE